MFPLRTKMANCELCEMESSTEKKPKHVARFGPGLSRYNTAVVKASISGLNHNRSAFPCLPQLMITISSYLYCIFSLLPSLKLFLRLPALKKKKIKEGNKWVTAHPFLWTLRWPVAARLHPRRWGHSGTCCPPGSGCPRSPAPGAPHPRTRCTSWGAWRSRLLSRTPLWNTQAGMRSAGLLRGSAPENSTCFTVSD